MPYLSASEVMIRKDALYQVYVHLPLPLLCACGQDYKPDEDPTTFKSSKTGRGPLVGADWEKSVSPVMCCYKLVTVEFKWWGLQGRVEKFIHRVCLSVCLSVCLGLWLTPLAHFISVCCCIAPCDLQGSKNRPAPFPGWMSYKATK